MHLVRMAADCPGGYFLAHPGIDMTLSTDKIRRKAVWGPDPGRRKAVWGLRSPLAVALLFVLAFASSAMAKGHPKLDSQLQNVVDNGGNVDVIIRVTPGGGNDVKGKLAANGHVVKGDYPGISALSVTINASDLGDLENKPERRVDLDRRPGQGSRHRGES